MFTAERSTKTELCYRMKRLYITAVMFIKQELQSSNV